MDQKKTDKTYISRWWFQICFIFTPKIGEGSHFDSYFSRGLKPPTRIKHIQMALSCFGPVIIFIPFVGWLVILFRFVKVVEVQN